MSKNFDRILNELDAIELNGGGDCPEMALTGLKNAIQKGLSNSVAFLFSDASAKDYTEVGAVRKLIEKKQTKVFFLLTGKCSENYSQALPAYDQVVENTNGLVLNMAKNSTIDVLRAVRLLIESVDIKSMDFGKAGKSVTRVSIDLTIKIAIFVASGANVNLKVKDASGNALTARRKRSVFSSAEIQIITIEVASPFYTVEASATSAYSLRIGGISDLKFYFGFSRKQPSSIDETSFLPFKGHKNILSIFASNPAQVKFSIKAKLVPAKSSDIFDEIEVVLKASKNDQIIYVSDPLNVPIKMFKIHIIGFDEKKNIIDRVISTGIEATSESKFTTTL